MTDMAKARQNPKALFWDELKDVPDVMLGTPDPLDHMQPMTGFAAPQENAVWFFTSTSTDIAKKAAVGGKTHMCVVNKDRDYHACVAGRLEAIRSQPHVDRYWSPVVGAWFPDGKDDPSLTMLKFTPEDGQIWASTGSALCFGWEIGKANMTGDKPDVGHMAKVHFP